MDDGHDANSSSFCAGCRSAAGSDTPYFSFTGSAFHRRPLPRGTDPVDAKLIGVAGPDGGR